MGVELVGQINHPIQWHGHPRAKVRRRQHRFVAEKILLWLGQEFMSAVPLRDGVAAA